MRLLPFLIIPLSFFAIFTIGSVTYAVTPIMRPQQRLLLPLSKQLSPLEFQEQEKKQLEQAVINRKRLKLPPVDINNARIAKQLYENKYAPTRNYTKQSCYHMADFKDPDLFTFCDATRCTFDSGQYCEHKSRNCYDNDGTLILTEKGWSATDDPKYVFIRWDMCLEKDGSPVTPKGEKSFDEKIKTGCGYRVGKKIHPYVVGYIGYMMTCDAYRCLFHPGGMVYNRETKLFRTSDEETKTPPYEYYPYLDWTCLNGKQANRVARKYRCSLVTEDKRNWGCEVCSENGKHVYTNCRYNYNEKGETAGMRVPLSEALENQLEELEYASDEFEQNPKTYHIVQAMSDIMMTLLRTPVSAGGQEKIVALFESFFSRRSEELWSNAKLAQELAALRNKIRSVMKK